MQKLIASVIALSLLMGTAFGLFFWFENRYCLAQEFRLFAQGTKYELKSLQLERLNERRWQLEERVEQKPEDKTAKEDLKRIEETKKKYEKELEKLGEVK